jgi:hypothetical protein
MCVLALCSMLQTGSERELEAVGALEPTVLNPPPTLALANNDPVVLFSGNATVGGIPSSAATAAQLPPAIKVRRERARRVAAGAIIGAYIQMGQRQLRQAFIAAMRERGVELGRSRMQTERS